MFLAKPAPGALLQMNAQRVLHTPLHTSTWKPAAFCTHSGLPLRAQPLLVRSVNSRDKHRESPIACRSPPRLSSLRHFFKLNNFKLWRRSGKKAIARKKRPTVEEWRALIREFEERADAKYATKDEADLSPPPGVEVGQVNEEQFESLPLVECAFMAGMTTVLWFVGRVLRLDSVVMLLYPLPTMYIAARWGLKCADRTLFAVLSLVFIAMGPIYAKLFFFNTGLLTLTYSRTLWWRWPWIPTLLAGATAKGVGLALQMALISVALRYNAWQAVTIQVTSMLKALSQLSSYVFGRAVFGAPGLTQVQIAIGIVVVIHSVYHVFFTLLTATLILRSVARSQPLARKPRGVPCVNFILKRMKPRRDYR